MKYSATDKYSIEMFDRRNREKISKYFFFKPIWLKSIGTDFNTSAKYFCLSRNTRNICFSIIDLCQSVKIFDTVIIIFVQLHFFYPRASMLFVTKNFLYFIDISRVTSPLVCTLLPFSFRMPGTHFYNITLD